MSTPARRAAYEILLRVETQSSYASELLYGAATEALSPQDAALCTELVLGALRWQGTLDFIAQHFSRRRWGAFDAEVKVALRLGLYQLRFLSRIPARAAVYEAVELVKEAGKRSAAGLVNAVLRQGAAAALDSLRPPALPEPAWWSVAASHPEWLLERWSKRYGRSDALTLARANNQPAVTCLRLEGTSEAAAEIEKRLREQGVETRPCTFLKPCCAVVSGAIHRTELYRRGAVAVQDEASQMVAYLLDVQEGHRVLDLCAAPGNKTMQLAQWAGETGWVLACDLHLHRLRETRRVAKVGNVSLTVLDGEQPLPFRIRFDRILVDAPCTGTGTLRRHPEIKWRLAEGDIHALAEKQLRLLGNAAAVLASGGRLVYSTCSLEEEENQQVVERFLEHHPEFRLLPLREEAARLEPFFHPSAQGLLQEEFLQTHPARDATDGFFAAILLKTRESV